MPLAIQAAIFTICAATVATASIHIGQVIKNRIDRQIHQKLMNNLIDQLEREQTLDMYEKEL